MRSHGLHVAMALVANSLLIVPLQVAAVDALPPEPVGLWELAKVSAGLLVVLLAIVATAAVLKRFKSLQGAHGRQIKIIDGVSVGTRDRVVLVEVDHTRVLLGVSPGRIESLHVFTPDAAAEPSFVELVERAEVPIGSVVTQ